MGLAASQARYLTLTSRKSDLELQSQTINARRIQLSYKTAEIARKYSEAMNNKKINIQVETQSSTNGNTTKSWTELKFDNLLENGYILIGSNGAALDPSPYKKNGETETETTHALSSNITSKTYKSDEIAELLADDTTKAAFVKTDVEGEYKLSSSISDELYEALKTKSAAIAADAEDSTAASTAAEVLASYDANGTTTTKGNWEVDPSYKGQDIQTLLVSGKAQIVTKTFFDYLCDKGGYEYGTGLASGTSFSDLLDTWNQTNTTSIVDWRSDETSTFKQKNYTEDDEAAIAEYEAANAEIQAQDKILEVEEKNIETQHKAIETELENVKKVVQKNIEDTFKIFS